MLLDIINMLDYNWLYLISDRGLFSNVLHGYIVMFEFCRHSEFSWKIFKMFNSMIETLLIITKVLDHYELQMNWSKNIFLSGCNKAAVNYTVCFSWWWWWTFVFICVCYLLFYIWHIIGIILVFFCFHHSDYANQMKQSEHRSSCGIKF